MMYRFMHFFAIIIVMYLIPRVRSQRPIVPATLDSPKYLSDGIWLAGDLHLHSSYSTDTSNNPVAKIIEFAKEVAKLDFIAITDHDNHVFGDVAANTWNDPAFSTETELLLLYGAEWTTDRGHGNTFAAQPYDHMALWEARNDRDAALLKLVRTQLQVHLSANHPSNNDPFNFSYDFCDSIEVWNSVLFASGLSVWDDLLKSGRRVTGRGGSDAHHGTPDRWDGRGPNTFERLANYVGTPTTWVYVNGRTADAVVEALTAGRVSVSANPFSPRVELRARTTKSESEGFPLFMGDNVKPPDYGESVKFEIRLVSNLKENNRNIFGWLFQRQYTVRVVRNGGTLLEYQTSETVLTFEDVPLFDGWTYYRVEVRGSKAAFPGLGASVLLGGDLVALSNPIYFNFDPDF